MKVSDIVVPIDFSECSKAALERAAELASQLGARLHLLHAVSPIPYPPEFGYGPEVLEDVEARVAQHLAAWAEALRERGCEVSETTELGPAVDAIHRAAERIGADLIVMGTHGHTGVKHLFLGSVAARTLRGASCPVWTVRESVADAASPVRRVLVPTDFSPHADHALEVAIPLCTAFGAELDVVHVFHNPLPVYAEIPNRAQRVQEFRDAAERRLQKALDAVKRAGLDGAADLLKGSCATAIAECARNHGIDLIVLGTRGHLGLQRAFLGIVAEGVLRAAPCSVLVTTAEHKDN